MAHQLDTHQSRPPALAFTPTPDTAVILHMLLDIYERRAARRANTGGLAQAVRCQLADLDLPGYFSQVNPEPRQVTNEQLGRLAQQETVSLRWLPGETGHLLQSITLRPEKVASLFRLLERTPQAAQRADLRDLLLGERFRFQDWRLAAVQHTLAQISAGKSPAPFSLTDTGHNQDLLTALAALDEVREETPYRVFSVRVFNDSKRFEALRSSLARLARRSQRNWHGWPDDEILRELNLVANPGHVYLYGPWQLIDETGELLSLGGFAPSVGVPARQVGRLQQVEVTAASRVVCVENLTSFYELIQHEPEALAAVCLWGNPSPAVRHLLRCLSTTLPADVPLLAWTDLDYGGFNILLQLRALAGGRVGTHHMNVETFERHRRWARPLTANDTRNLKRLAQHPQLAAERPLITHMLQRGLKLEQEAIDLTGKKQEQSSP